MRFMAALYLAACSDTLRLIRMKAVADIALAESMKLRRNR